MAQAVVRGRDAIHRGYAFAHDRRPLIRVFERSSPLVEADTTCAGQDKDARSANSTLYDCKATEPDLALRSRRPSRERRPEAPSGTARRAVCARRPECIVAEWDRRSVRC